MNVKKYPITILLVVLTSTLSSCAFVLDKLDRDENNPIIELTTNSKQTFCTENKSYIQLISQNEKSHKSFSTFLLKLESVAQLAFIDKVVLWSLLQMNLRPDLTAPQSKIQILLTYKGKQEFINYYHQNHDWTFLISLEQLLKKYDSRYSLMQLARYLDDYHPNRFYVSQDFASFLQTNKPLIAQNPSLKNIYMRAEETLRENERISRQPLTKLISQFKRKKKKNKKIKPNDYLFNYNITQKISTRCNYDMGLYESSIYLINDKFIRNNIFGLKEGKNAFIASTSQGLEKIDHVNNTIFFKGEGKAKAAALCQFSKKNKNLWLLSTDSRDPGQHIYHLLEYGLQDISQIEEMDKMLKFSRHLFLQEPVRLIFESNRSTKEQLQELLKLNIPIYYANNLGRIWGLYQDDKQFSFLLDDRKNGTLSCTTN